MNPSGTDPVERLRSAVRRTAELVRGRQATGLTHEDADGQLGTVGTDSAIGFDPLGLLTEFHRRGVRVVAIGQVAGILHGSTELTGDLDLLWDGSPEHAAAMAEVFASVGARLTDDDGNPVPCEPATFLLPKVDFSTPGASGDCCTPALVWGGLDVADFAGRALSAVAPDGALLHYLDRADLIAMRRAIGRPKDLRRAAELESLGRVSVPVYPPKPRPGDKVAILSPAAALADIFPLPYELGLRRLREEFGLVPVEYPATRTYGSSPQARADDLHAAFADPEIKAVIASIGGEDQITLLPFLDKELIRANPKPFFGYSDNTNLLLFLRNLGIVSYHGSSVMVELGRPGALNPLTADSLRAALFGSGPYELRAAEQVGDVTSPWQDPQTFASEPVMEAGDGWSWHNADRVVEGLGWGGNLEILSWMLMADREIRPVQEYAGQVLYLETSEEMPGADEVYRILRNMGERGLLRQFPAVLVARAKSWSFEQPLDPEAKAAYRKGQREAVLLALAGYAPDAVAVFDVDFGHTDPQLVIPCGGRIRVDGPGRRITVDY